MSKKVAVGPALKPADEMKKHAQLMTWFQQEMRRQSVNRYQMALDEDYYDSEQWTASE